MFVFIQNLIVIMFYTLLCFMCEYEYKKYTRFTLYSMMGLK